jgi:hypothetical protein
MVESLPDSELEISRLRARVARLEQLLATRSRLLQDLTPELCAEDLVSYSRLASGLSPIARSAFGLGDWRETTALTVGEVERTMEQLWRSLARGRREAE